MANIKSAAKRAQIAKVRTLRNKSAMSKVKTTIKAVEAAVAAKDAEAAKAALVVAIKTIDKAASKGILHKNNAANKKSRLTKMVNAMQLRLYLVHIKTTVSAVVFLFAETHIDSKNPAANCDGIL